MRLCCTRSAPKAHQKRTKRSTLPYHHQNNQNISADYVMCFHTSISAGTFFTLQNYNQIYINCLVWFALIALWFCMWLFFWTFCPLAGSLDSGVAAQGAVAGMLPETSRPWYSSTSLASSDLASPGAVRLPSANPSTATPSQGNGGEFYPKQHLFGFFAPCIYLHPCWITTRSHLWVCALEDRQDHEEWRHAFFTSDFEMQFTSVGHDSPC